MGLNNKKLRSLQNARSIRLKTAACFKDVDQFYEEMEVSSQPSSDEYLSDEFEL